ncbi:MAG: STAS domain-containing protein [Myxococcales bacterium]|nr:STAS domain-containing protein [Myxococcales bacterium]
MKYTTQENPDNILIIRMIERDLFTHQPECFEKEILALIKIAEGRLVFNFSQLNSFDSNLLRVLTSALKESLKYPCGDIKLVGLNSIMRHILHLSHLDCVFCHYESEADAVTAFQSPAISEILHRHSIDN